MILSYIEPRERLELLSEISGNYWMGAKVRASIRSTLKGRENSYVGKVIHCVKKVLIEVDGERKIAKWHWPNECEVLVRGGIDK